MPAGQALSEHLGSKGDLKWLLVPLLDGFGLVAIIGLAPIVSVMIVGVLFEYKKS